MTEHATGVPSVIRRHYTLDRVVMRACMGCGAPGVYKHHESILAGWPGCYVEAGDERANQSVGDVCPNCHIRRPEPEPLPQIEVEWRV